MPAAAASIMLDADELTLILQTLSETTFSGKLSDLTPVLERVKALRAKLDAARGSLAATLGAASEGDQHGS